MLIVLLPLLALTQAPDGPRDSLPPAPASADSAASRMSGGGIAFLRFGREGAGLPMLSYRITGLKGDFLVPDFTLSGVPPFVFFADLHFGMATRVSDDLRIGIGGGPSVVASLAGYGGAAMLGVGFTVSFLSQSDPRTVVRLDIGPRFYRPEEGGRLSDAMWLFGFNIQTLSRPRCNCGPEAHR